LEPNTFDRKLPALCIESLNSTDCITQPPSIVRPGDAAVKDRFLRFRAPCTGGDCNLRLVGFCSLPGFCSAPAPGYVIEIRVIRVIRGLVSAISSWVTPARFV
jgi:hypothetical protein